MKLNGKGKRKGWQPKEVERLLPLVVYSVGDPSYLKNRIRYFQSKGRRPEDVQIPLSVNVAKFFESTDQDIEMIPYMNGSQIRILVCVVTPNPNDAQGKSIGRYFVLALTAGENAITWELLGNNVNGIQLSHNGTIVGGNPTGFAQFGCSSYLSEYDSPNVYRLNTQAFEDAITNGAPTYTVLGAFDAASAYHLYHPITSRDKAVSPTPGVTLVNRIHGVGICGLYDEKEETTYLYPLLNYVEENADMDYMPVNYYPSLLVRIPLDEDGDFDGSNVGAVQVGKNAACNAIGFPGLSEIVFITAGMGGPQNNGQTNGTYSLLCKIGAFDSRFEKPDDPDSTDPPQAPVAIHGDANTASQTETPDLDIGQNLDFKNVLILDNGQVFVFTGTFGLNWTFWWRLYKTTLTYLLKLDNVSLADIAGDPEFAEVDAGYGAPGSFMEVTGSNVARRVWTVLGSLLKVSDVDNYGRHVTFGAGVLYGEADEGPELTDVRINSGCLLSDMAAAQAMGHSLDHRMIKGRHLSKIAAARMALSRGNTPQDNR